MLAAAMYSAFLLASCHDLARPMPSPAQPRALPAILMTWNVGALLGRYWCRVMRDFQLNSTSLSQAGANALGSVRMRCGSWMRWMLAVWPLTRGTKPNVFTTACGRCTSSLHSSKSKSGVHATPAWSCTRLCGFTPCFSIMARSFSSELPGATNLGLRGSADSSASWLRNAGSGTTGS